MTLNYLPEILKSWRIISKRKYYPLEKFQVVGENRYFLSAQVYYIVSLTKLLTSWEQHEVVVLRKIRGDFGESAGWQTLKQRPGNRGPAEEPDTGLCNICFSDND